MRDDLVGVVDCWSCVERIGIQARKGCFNGAGLHLDRGERRKCECHRVGYGSGCRGSIGHRVRRTLDSCAVKANVINFATMAYTVESSVNDLDHTLTIYKDVDERKSTTRLK